MRFHAPYMEWAKKRPAATYDLAGSNVLACTIDDLAGARDALTLSGNSDNGYTPLVAAIAERYGVSPEQVATANGAAGANFQAFAAIIGPGDDVLMERPGYDPLPGAARLLGANIIYFERRFEDGFALDPDAVARAMTPRTRLVIVTSPHNPTGVVTGPSALAAVGDLARKSGAFVVVDEVYLDAADTELRPAVLLGEQFISTSSLTKSYGLSSLRCGWSLSSPAMAERIRRARDVIDGSGSVAAEQLGTLAFVQLDKLMARTATILSRNRPLVHDFIRHRPDLEAILPGNSTVVFPRIRGLDDTSAFAERLLNERGTAVVPGRYFDLPAHIRLGFGGPTAALQAGLERLGAALDALGTP
jgi:aspartate/methionine/tyrosine aminotransferase